MPGMVGIYGAVEVALQPPCAAAGATAPVACVHMQCGGGGGGPCYADSSNFFSPVSAG